jgi:hypothetical protein
MPAKKSVKKSATKRAHSVKPRITHPELPPEQYFILADGRALRNVKELAEILEQLEDHVFHHHVNEIKNDFATWVKDVFKDIELAEQLAAARDKRHAQLVIYKHITRRMQ